MTNEEVLQKMDEDFLLRRSSPKTQSTYKTLIDRFFRFSEKPRYDLLDESDLRRYLLYLRTTQKVSDSSSNTINSACKFMLRVVLNLHLNDSQLPNAKTHHKMQVYFSTEQLKLFFKELDNITPFTFFLVLYGTGARMKEIAEIRSEDIIKRQDTHFLIICHGKGNKERMVHLPDACYEVLRLYWKYQRFGNTHNWIFPNDKNGHMNPNHFTTVFRAVSNNIKLGKEFHPHSFRHTYANNVLQNNQDNILCLKNSLGHSSLASTEIYLRSSSVDTTNKKSPDEICMEILETYLASHEF